jgi:hypothetical protein
VKKPVITTHLQESARFGTQSAQNFTSGMQIPSQNFEI